MFFIPEGAFAGGFKSAGSFVSSLSVGVWVTFSSPHNTGWGLSGPNSVLMPPDSLLLF